MHDLDHERTPRLPIGELLRREEEELRRVAGQAEPTVVIGAVSHPGLSRPRNEDHYLALRVGRTLETVSTNLPAGDLPPRLELHGQVLMVADGIGGRSAGGHASRRAIGAMVELATRVPDWILKIDEPGMADYLGERGRAYFERVDELLEAEAGSDPALSGMGTTMTVVYLLGSDLLFVHVGDSRAYQLRGRELTRLTRDQTMAQALADAGLIPEEAVASHRHRHILTGALGAAAGRPKIEVGRHRIEPGDRILVASDGLTEMVPEPEIADLLARHAEPQAACDALLAAALAAGGHDNVTILVARCGD